MIDWIASAMKMSVQCLVVVRKVNKTPRIIRKKILESKPESINMPLV